MPCASGCLSRLSLFALKSEFPPDDYDKFSVMPQRGYGLQPRVAASATLGKESFVHFSLRKRRNRVAVEISFLTSSQGSRTATLGWRP